jgi:uncharacterized protein YbaR (Trm112 family)
MRSSCPFCQAKLEYQVEMVGQVIDCPVCKGRLLLTAALEAQPAPPLAPAQPQSHVPSLKSDRLAALRAASHYPTLRGSLRICAALGYLFSAAAGVGTFYRVAMVSSADPMILVAGTGLGAFIMAASWIATKIIFEAFSVLLDIADAVITQQKP